MSTFKIWWLANTGLHTEYPGPREIAEIAWNAAASKAEPELRQKLLDYACEVFREGDVQRAKIIRDLADIRHNIWS